MVGQAEPIPCATTKRTMTNRTARTHEVSLAVFISNKVEFDALLGEIKLASNDQFGANPEAVLWGETTWLSDATAR